MTTRNLGRLIDFNDGSKDPRVDILQELWDTEKKFVADIEVIVNVSHMIRIIKLRSLELFIADSRLFKETYHFNFRNSKDLFQYRKDFEVNHDIPIKLICKCEY